MENIFDKQIERYLSQKKYVASLQDALNNLWFNTAEERVEVEELLADAVATIEAFEASVDFSQTYESLGIWNEKLEKADKLLYNRVNALSTSFEFIQESMKASVERNSWQVLAKKIAEKHLNER